MSQPSSYQVAFVLRDRLMAEALAERLRIAEIRFRSLGLQSPAHIGAGDALAEVRFEVSVDDLPHARQLFATLQHELVVAQAGAWGTEQYARAGWRARLVRLWLGTATAFLMALLLVGVGYGNPFDLARQRWIPSSTFIVVALIAGAVLSAVGKRWLRNLLIAVALIVMTYVALVGVYPASRGRYMVSVD